MMKTKNVLNQLPLRKKAFSHNNGRQKKTCHLTICLMAFLIFATGNQHISAQAFDWVKGVGGNDHEMSRSVAIDDSGYIYTTGHYGSATVNLNPIGGGLLTNASAGTSDIFIAKYDSKGNCIWAKSLGRSDNDQTSCIRADRKGHIYISGWYKSDTIDLNPGGLGGKFKNEASVDAFIAKYDVNGNFIWGRNIGGNLDDQAYSLGVDDTGNVYVTGYFGNFRPGAGTINFNIGGTGGTFTSNGRYDIFLAKYDKNGNYAWGKALGGNANDYAYALTVDSTGNTYITGGYNSTVTFNPGGTGGILTGVGFEDIFLAKYDAAGNFIWVNSFGDAAADKGRAVVLDATGNVYIAGEFGEGTIDFNPGSGRDTLVCGGFMDVFLAKYDKNGNYLWAKGMGGADADAGYGLALDLVGNVYMTGTFQSQRAEFNRPANKDTLVSAGGDDIFVAKYKSNGGFIWAKRMGGTDYDKAEGIAVGDLGDVYVTGYFASTQAEFNPGGAGGTLINVSAGLNDGYLVRLACSDTVSTLLTLSTCERNYLWQDSAYTTDGIYVRHFPNLLGCDSMVTLNLSFYQLDPMINVNGFTLGVASSFTTYQWLKNGVIIPNATGSTYHVTEDGDYQVIVTNGNNCIDTSDKYNVSNTSIDNTSLLARQISIYPNPTSDILQINSPVDVHIHLYSIEGRSMLSANTATISIGNLAKGIYMLHVTDTDGRLIKVEKVVKQ